MKNNNLEKVKKIIALIEKNSKRPIENKKAFEKYLLESIIKNKKITFYNWECPPRFLDIDKNGKYFVNYDVDLKKIFKSKKIDNFTEFPRVVEEPDEEIKTLLFLKSMGIKYRFVKVIADTNAFYITPESIKILGKIKIKKKYAEFKKLIQQSLKKYPISVKVCFFTDLIKKDKAKYDEIYLNSKNILKKDTQKLLAKKIIVDQIKRTRDHVGILGKKEAFDFAINTIATYAAEGIVFDKLSKTPKFSNCVWLNNHEVDDRTIQITNCYRRKLKFGNLPMVFL